MNSNKCPICGKDGIRDFRNEIVVCPCCGSDLSAYHHLYRLAQQPHLPKTKKNHLITISFVAAAIVLIGLSLWQYTLVRKDFYDAKAELESVQEQNKMLSDSVNIINMRLYELTNNPAIEKHNSIYIVRKGDSFCKISKRLFGDESRYAEIITLNNLSDKSLIFQGDTLIVPTR